MGKLDDRQVLTAACSASGQLSMGPSGVLAQSNRRTRAPVSPPEAVARSS
jgi:hypothetical protein